MASLKDLPRLQVRPLHWQSQHHGMITINIFTIKVNGGPALVLKSFYIKVMKQTFSFLRWHYKVNFLLWLCCIVLLLAWVKIIADHHLSYKELFITFKCQSTWL